MKLKLAALLILVSFLMAMSSPVTGGRLDDVKANLKAALSVALCTACNTACGTVSDKCYAQFQEGTKGEEICGTVEEKCYAKCPCE